MPASPATGGRRDVSVPTRVTAVDTIGAVGEPPVLPEDVARAAAGRRLGNMLSMTRPGRPWSAWLGVLAAAATVVVPAACISGTSGEDFTGLYWGIGIISAILLLFEMLSLARQRWMAQVYAVEFEHGLVYVEPGHTQAFRWEEVQLVRHADYVHGAQGSGSVVHRTVLRGPTGNETAVNDNLAFDRIAQHLTDAAADRAQAVLARGERVAFGAVIADPDGLATDAGRVAWTDLERVEQTQQEVRIYRRAERRPAARIRIGAVPDAAALVRLATARRPPSAP